jgi:5-(carboxyamino)imidazole ribonucleotide synthase
MLNLLGALPSTDAVLSIPGAHFHDYGKDPRPGRKVGHCTLVDPDRERLLERFRGLQRALAAPEQ